MQIAVPSKNRYGKTTTQNILPNAIFYVPDSEVKLYKEVCKNVVGVPNNVQGITATRNWILKNCKSPRVVFIDDDVRSCGYVKMFEEKARKKEIKDEAFWLYEFEKLFDVTEQMKYKIWGIRTESSPIATYPYKPFIFKAYVTASCMGIINDGEFMFDELFKVKEDYEICLRHIIAKGGIVAARYIFWENEHWTTEGGCKDYRTMDIEKDAINRLIELYPSMIGEVKRKSNEFCIRLNL